MFLSFQGEEEEYDDDMSNNIVTRSVFPESWMWMDLDLPDCKEKQKWSVCQFKNLV